MHDKQPSTVPSSGPSEFDFPSFIQGLLEANHLTISVEQTFEITRAVIQAQALLLRAAVAHRHQRELCASTEQLVRFCVAPESDDPRLSTGCIRCAPKSTKPVQKPYLPERWSDEDYGAGYRAFFDHRRFNFAGSGAWQSGWVDASRELEHEELDLRALNEMPAPRQISMYGSGKAARNLGLPLDEDAPAKWQVAWLRRHVEIAEA